MFEHTGAPFLQTTERAKSKLRGSTNYILGPETQKISNISKSNNHFRMNQTPLRKHLTSAQSLGKHLMSIGRRNFSNSLLQHRSADNDVASRNSLPALLTTRPVTFD